MTTPSVDSTNTRFKTYVGQDFNLDGKPVVCVDVKPSGSVIRDQKTGEEWPGIKFKVRPKGGGRAYWTVAFPDKESVV